jgi:hypothetical protein
MSGQPASEDCGHSERTPSHVPRAGHRIAGRRSLQLGPAAACRGRLINRRRSARIGGGSFRGPRRFAAPAPAGMVPPRGQPAGTVAPCERRALWSPSSNGRIIGSGVAGGANGSPSRISRAAAGPSRHIASAWGIRSSIWWRGGARQWPSSRSRPGARSRGARPPRACGGASGEPSSGWPRCGASGMGGPAMRTDSMWWRCGWNGAGDTGWSIWRMRGAAEVMWSEMSHIKAIDSAMFRYYLGQ